MEGREPDYTFLLGILRFRIGIPACLLELFFSTTDFPAFSKTYMCAHTGLNFSLLAFKTNLGQSHLFTLQNCNLRSLPPSYHSGKRTASARAAKKHSTTKGIDLAE